ncbi:kelch-like protein 41 isoform X2 [Ptychodera flava]|uniref:kelch-like protein 41 isoform X2 n=1 Tax=Ptychodera flava TaxID=63121 RepID=UPI003969D6BB
MDANMKHLFNKTEITQPKFDTPVTGEELVEETFNKAEKKLRDHSELSERMADMFTKEEFSDVVIKVGDKRYSAHKIILMNSSEYFCKMFGPDWKEQQQSAVTLNEDNVHCQRYFGEFVKYLYTGTVDISLDSVLYYLILADKYLVESLMKTCVKYMDEHFNANPDTCLCLALLP